MERKEKIKSHVWRELMRSLKNNQECVNKFKGMDRINDHLQEQRRIERHSIVKIDFLFLLSFAFNFFCLIILTFSTF